MRREVVQFGVVWFGSVWSCARPWLALLPPRTSLTKRLFFFQLIRRQGSTHRRRGQQGVAQLDWVQNLDVLGAGTKQLRESLSGLILEERWGKECTWSGVLFACSPSCVVHRSVVPLLVFGLPTVRAFFLSRFLFY